MKLLDLPYLNELVAFRRDLHAHPELAFEEQRTAARIALELAHFGLEVHEGLARTGVVGLLRRGGSPRAIGLRADMDALPMTEGNSFPHASTVPGKMHGCGHDGHVAMLLGAARYLAEQGRFDGTVVFIFQPAEEGEGGARQMLEEGLLERFPVDSVYGLHNWPGLDLGQVAIMDGPVMAGTCGLEISLSGKGCHAAMPHLGTDVIVAGAALVKALQTVVSRQLHPCDAAVVSITQFHAGEAWNVIPSEAVLRGTIRTFKPEVQKAVETAIYQVCEGIGTSYGVQIRARLDLNYPPTINTPKESALCREVASALFGHEAVLTDELPSMGAEDFAYFLQSRPGCYAWLGNGQAASRDSSGHGGACSLHNPYYDFNDSAIPLGVSYWVRLAESLLPAKS